MSTSAPVVETVSRKRIIPPGELEKEKRERTTPEFWEFIEGMTPDQWASDFILYILREDPKPSMYGGTNTLEKCPGYIAMPDGTKQLLNSREDIELAIKQKYGGKAYRLILKKGSERICEGKCVNEAPPRYPDTMQQPPAAAATAVSGDASSIASKAMDMAANHNPQLLQIAIDAVSRTADILARHQTPPAAPSVPPPASADEEINRALRTAMIQKFLAPPPDPFEMLLKFKQVMGDGGVGGGSASGLVEKILSAAADKLLNPTPPAVSGRTTLLDLGREFIPVLGATVRETMHEYRLATEANVRIAEMQRGAAAPPSAQPNPAVLQPPPIDVAAQPAAAAAPAAENPAPQAAAAPTFQWVAQRVARIVKNVEYPIDEAVDRVISFLYDTDDRLIALLLDPPKLDSRLSPGKAGLMQLFQYEPALKDCMVNPPRVSEFVEKFIVAATEAEAAEARLRAAAPGSAAPPAAVPGATT